MKGALLLLLAPGALAFWPFGAPLLRADPLKEMNAQLTQGRWDEAARSARQGLEGQDLRPKERQRAYAVLGRSLELLGRYDEALGDYQVAVQLYPKAWKLVLAEAQLLQKVGLDGEARPLFERVLKLDAGNSEANAGLAESFRRQGLLDEAAKHYRLALSGKLGEDAGVWRRYAQTLGNQRDFFNAEQACDKSLSLQPDAAVWELKAVDQHAQGKHEEALASLGEALRLSPEDPDLALRRALWLLKLGRLDEARGQTDAVLAKRPGHALGLWVRAALKLREGKADEAARHFWLAQAQGKGFVQSSAAAMAKALQKPAP